MPVFNCLRRGLLAGLAALVAACASRTVPAHYPESSAASPQAPAARSVEVAQTLATKRGAANESATPAAADRQQESHEGRHASH